MKRLSTIIMALVLALGLTQCKKNEQPTTENQGEAVTISLQVKNGNDAKVLVNPETGTVDYEVGDQILVASAGKYVGTLTYNGTLFTGAIGNATEGLPLQFYFLGNVTPAETLSIGATESVSVVISDQTQHLPVISAAPSVENFYGDVTDYTAELKNKCALVKFNVTTSSEAATCVTGFNNKVTVNFAENSFTNSQEGEGVITLPAGNGEHWAILLPQDALGVGNAYSADEAYLGTYGEVPALYVNGYFPAGIAVEVTTKLLPGVISGLFSVSETQQVYFSQGNLQYIGSAATPYWKFADHQWDYLGTTTGQNSSDENVDRDLFGWGTSGYNHGAVCYQPWSTSMSYSDYWVYGQSNYHLYDGNGQADWGYNAISNGGNMEGQWRTLTIDEWEYVFNTRSTTSGIHYAKATVNNVNGVVLLPDNWAASTYALNSANNSGANFTTNTITAEDWANTLEANGAVFLPASGVREGTSAYFFGSYGYYWSATYNGDGYAYYVMFNNGLLNSLNNDFLYRSYCLSVRLVRNAE